MSRVCKNSASVHNKETEMINKVTQYSYCDNKASGEFLLLPVSMATKRQHINARFAQ
jgi:hypothetical protein